MSVTFSVAGQRYDIEDYDSHVNVSNANARVLLDALGAPGADEPQPYGSMLASDLAHLCMKLVNGSEVDAGEKPSEPLRDAASVHVVHCGRRPGYTQETAQRLWKLALKAPPKGEISWS